MESSVFKAMIPEKQLKKEVQGLSLGDLQVQRSARRSGREWCPEVVGESGWSVGPSLRLWLPRPMGRAWKLAPWTNHGLVVCDLEETCIWHLLRARNRDMNSGTHRTPRRWGRKHLSPHLDEKLGSCCPSPVTLRCSGVLGSLLVPRVDSIQELQL